MVILTIGTSPFVSNRCGLINKELILALKAAGHHVESLVTSHDLDYFLPTDIDRHEFDVNGIPVCQIHPFTGLKGELAQRAMQVLSRLQPRVVITIGDYWECAFMAVIKSRYRSLFKWIAVLPSGTTHINERFSVDLEMADYIITTTAGAKRAVERICRVENIEHVAFGADGYGDLGLRDRFSVLWAGQNSQSDNPGAFLKAMEGFEGEMHYNIGDRGDYDLKEQMRRLGLEKNVILPSKFVSLREGIPHSEMNQLYNRHTVIVDCSLQSGTAVGMLEAMLTGCIPVGVDFGAVGEVINKMPEQYRFLVPHETFIGPRDEENAIISPTKLNETLGIIKKRYSEGPEWFREASTAAKTVAAFFRKDSFTERVNSIVEGVVYFEHALVVDSF